MTKAELDPYQIARVIASRAFGAVRGQRSTGTGAAPAHVLAGLGLTGLPDDKRTVARKAGQGRFPGSPPPSTATPFDYAMARLYDWDANGGKDEFAAAADIMATILDNFSMTELIDTAASLFRVTVQAEIHEPRRRFLTGFAVQALAIEYLNENEFRAQAGGPSQHEGENLTWATWLLERRRLEAERTTESFVALLSFGLLLLGRRPKAGYQIVNVVRAIQALWSGSLLQYHLNPGHFPEYQADRLNDVDGTSGLPPGDGSIERAMVDLMFGMTEDSVFAAQAETADQSAVIAEALRQYKKAGGPVELVPTAKAVGIDPANLEVRFPSSSDLAQACFQWLATGWEGFYRFADEFRTAAPSGAEALLVWIQTLAVEYPHLLQSATFGPGDRTFEELASLIAGMLSRQRHGPSDAPSPDAMGRARRCLVAAAAGTDWRAPIDR